MASVQETIEPALRLDQSVHQRPIGGSGEGPGCPFIQNYTSSGYQSVGKKELTIIREGGVWKIYRETSEKI